MYSLNSLPIWRDANRLLVHIERAVRQFPRYHKYALGSDLRHQARSVCRCLLQATSATDERLSRVEVLIAQVDELKLLIQLAKELECFRSFAEFQAIAELAVVVGKQSGGWRKRLAAVGGPNRAPS